MPNSIATIILLVLILFLCAFWVWRVKIWRRIMDDWPGKKEEEKDKQNKNK